MFLTILKISGIAVLSILGIIVLTLLLLLFVPIRYRAKGVAAENTLQMEGKISWLLHFVAASFEIAKTQKKLNTAQSESLKATYTKQLKQLEALKKDVINRIAVLSMVVDIDPNTFVQHGRKRR